MSHPVSKDKVGVCKVAQQIRAIAAKTDDLSSNLRSHMMEGKNQLPKDIRVLTRRSLYTPVHSYRLTHILNKCMFKNVFSLW